MFNNWVTKNKFIIDNYYVGEAGPKEVEDLLLQTEAEGYLARSISVNIVGELEARFHEENFEIKENTLKDNINSYFSTNLKNIKKLVVEDNRGYTIHLFKCKDEIENDKIEYKKKLSRRVKEFLSEYESHMRDKRYSYAFKPLCKAYLLAKSAIYPLEEKSNAEHKLVEYLANILIKFEPGKVIDCKPGIKVPENKWPTVTLSFRDTKNPMDSFKLSAFFSRGGNNWPDQNRKLRRLNKLGKTKIDLGVIESATQNQEVFIYPDTSDFFTEQGFSISNTAKRSLVKELDGVFKSGKTFKVSLNTNFKIRFNDPDDYHLDCSAGLRNIAYNTIRQSLYSSRNFELSDDENIYDMIVRVHQTGSGFYGLRAELMSPDNEKIAHALIKCDSDLFSRDKASVTGYGRKKFSELFQKLNNAAYTSKISYRLANEDITIMIKDDGRTDFERNKILSDYFIVANGRVHIKFLYKGEIFYSVTKYISDDIDLSDEFHGKEINFHPKKISYEYVITKPKVKTGLILSWKRKKPSKIFWETIESERWSLSSRGFNKLRTPIKADNNFFHYKLLAKKDGWKDTAWEIKPDIMSKEIHIKSIKMNKVDLNVIKQLKFALVPGIGQRELYRTKPWRKIQSYFYHVFALALSYSAYRSYQGYEVARGEYLEHKNMYESLYDSDDPELFSFYYENAKYYNNQMTNSINQFNYQTGALGIFYVINLVDVIYSVIKFHND